MSSLNESELFRIGLNIRKQLGRPQFTDMTKAVSAIVDHATVQIDQLVSDEHKLIDQIQKFKDAAKRELTPLTPAYVSAKFLESMTVPMNQSAFKEIEEGSAEGKMSAAAALDLIYGFQTTAEAVLIAHKPILFSTQGYVAEFNKGNIVMPEADFLRIIGYRQRQIVKMAGLLADDPTAYSVLRWQVNELRTFEQNTGGWIKTFRAPGFVIAGAELAGYTYGKIYPTAENLFTEQ